MSRYIKVIKWKTLLRSVEEYIVVPLYDCCLLIICIMWLGRVCVLHVRPAILQFSSIDVLKVMCKRLLFRVLFLVSPFQFDKTIKTFAFFKLFVLLNCKLIYLAVQAQCTIFNYIMIFWNTIWFMHTSHTINKCCWKTFKYNSYCTVELNVRKKIYCGNRKCGSN